jgi:hypothetical protein
VPPASTGSGGQLGLREAARSPRVFEQIGPIHLSTISDRAYWPSGWQSPRTYLLSATLAGFRQPGGTMKSNTHDVPFHARHEDELLTLDEVAEILTTSPNTVRWWRQQGTGPEFFKIGQRLYTTVGDLRA